MNYYTGIGSRDISPHIRVLFENVGTFLANSGLILRSGAATGSDTAFETGCDRVNGKKEIYLPWEGFEGSNSKLIVEDGMAFDIAKEFHPYWHNLKQGAQKLQARNSHQVLGKNLNTPSQFIVCWTKGGKGSGGTGQALRIAKKYNIPVFDAGKYDEDMDVLRSELKLFLRQFL